MLLTAKHRGDIVSSSSLENMTANRVIPANPDIHIPRGLFHVKHGPSIEYALFLHVARLIVAVSIEWHLLYVARLIDVVPVGGKAYAMCFLMPHFCICISSHS